MSGTTFDLMTGWQAISGCLPANYRELADEHKQVQTQFGNAKISTADDLLRLVLLHVGADLPLRQTVAVMAEAGGPAVSHVRLHKKMLRAAPYFRDLVRGMVRMPPMEPERWAGYQVTAVDATTVTRDGADGADTRLHVKIRLADLEFLAVRVEDVSVGETFKRFSWQPGELVVGDRGYCNPPGIARVVEDGADVLVRVCRGTLPMKDPVGEAVDLMAWLRSLRSYHASERDVVIHAKEQGRDVCGRLIAIRLPVAQAEQARARLIREHGAGNVSELDREAASYVVLFTTAPRSRLNAYRCIELYRLRWQIELSFKRWKSLCGLDRLPNHLDESISTWLYAKVLLALLMQRMGASALSPPEVSAPPSRRRRRNVGPTRVEVHVDPLASHPLGSLAARSA